MILSLYSYDSILTSELSADDLISASNKSVKVAQAFRSRSFKIRNCISNNGLQK